MVDYNHRISGAESFTRFLAGLEIMHKSCIFIFIVGASVEEFKFSLITPHARVSPKKMIRLKEKIMESYLLSYLLLEDMLAIEVLL